MVFVLWFITGFSQPRKVNSETEIQQVTVFSSGAQIQRNANVSVLPGRTEIVFTGLSNQLDQQSLQLKADANIVLLSVQTVKDFFGQRKIEQDERALINRRSDLEEKIENDQKLLQVYKEEEEMVRKNQSIGGSTGVKSEELKQALDLQRQRLTEIFQKQLEVERRIRQQQQDLSRSTLQLNEISKKKDSVNYSVVALIDCKETRNIKFQLIYTVRDAGWFPAYDVRVTEVGKPLSVLMNANVFQRSGETWKDVNLQLSTGNPKDNATPSALEPWRLGFYDPTVAWMKAQAGQAGTITGRVTDDKGQPLSGATVMVKGTNIATTTDANGFFRFSNVPANGALVFSYVGFNSKEIAIRQGYYTIAMTPASNMQEIVVVGYSSRVSVSADELPPPPSRRKIEEIQPVSISTEYQPTTTVYVIDDKYTLETDGKTTTIGIRQFDVPALYEHFSVPKVDPSVFLTAKIINWEDYELQSGEASLYFEGTYLGKTYIDLSASTDTLSLSLGKDNGVKISRKLVKDFSSKRLIGSNRTESKSYEITVRNTKRAAVNLIIQDQFPVSITKEIDVDDRKAPDAKLNDETGSVTWNLTLPPGAEKKLSISYSVKYPKDRKVIL
jgi:hypothetical protein